ncbi:MAG: DMT family transporter [Nitrosomonadales bacterium]|jgi:drug/metabolite transporter (DMT)-like permease|nr:DMT family transporter [Nitrosomonadales bacterium]MBT3918147.1 DMT family transporter [Nitrosomonadales bacterium]MBT4182621.1 DMT family transporter [Nitrosomonadales bacterium]MBT4570847.1 DMT family transporter [Nitrosomonadales bacterium]MBT4759255.1 DMT family transporter [Nitrosomonadales bacterium]
MQSTVRNYQYLILMIIIWGSSFAMMHECLVGGHFSPEQTVGYRLAIGSIVLLMACIYCRKAFPKSLTPWVHFFIYAVIGNIVPFMLISRGQMHITSGMTGLLMALVPLVTMVLAHIFLPNNALNRYKIIGFILGVSGVFFILAPSINDGNNTLFGILLILGAAASYASHGVVVEKFPKYDPIVAATCSSILACFLAFLIWPDMIYLNLDGVPLKTSLNMLALGLFPTGLGALIFFNLINNTGAVFLSNMNYAIPVYAFILGTIMLGEPVLWQNILALVLIVFGIFVSRIKV